ncbi:MAG: alpha/beta fold hydrolase [Myxococcota bacterium]
MSGWDRIRTLVSMVALACGVVSWTDPALGGESAERFFSGRGLTDVVVSPDGAWLAARAQRGDESIVMVQRIGVEQLVGVTRARWVGRVAWKAPATLVVEESSTAGVYRVLVARLALRAGRIDVDRDVIQAQGMLVDPLPLVPEELLWLFVGHRGWTSLHRVSIAQLLAFHDRDHLEGWTVDLGEKLASVKGVPFRWIVQRDGKPRAALRYREEGTDLMLPLAGIGPLAPIRNVDDKTRADYVRPVGLTPDERSVLVAAYGDGDTLGLYEWDAFHQRPGRAVFVRSDYDVAYAISDPLTGELVAAAYETAEGRRYHYFDAYRDRFLSRLPADWRRDSIRIRSGSADRQVFAFFESSATNPGDFWVRDRSGAIARVGRFAEDLDRSRLSPVESLRVPSNAGVEIEAFLALPRHATVPVPLVVIPHGGPHGIRDDNDYDPLVQYLASWGYAVLQVNYRGSAGYGRHFLSLVKKARGTGIEDDIDAAVEQAMERSAIDARRICILGGSYGGFSAFASIVRHRDRYRCAVSINGGSDIPLSAESSDYADDERSLGLWQEYVGDVEEEREALLERSPAYHVDRIETPVLVVYGRKDRRVDPDHSHRMIAMLELYGKPHEVLEIEDAEHGFERDGWILVARTVRRFLAKHLEPDSPFVPDP